MKAYIFPDQGAQFVGMGLDLYEKSAEVKALFEVANSILGFAITEEMSAGTDKGLKQTKITQPAILLHSVILGKVLGKDFASQTVVGHSLDELSALVANGTLTFEDGLQLVAKRAAAMQGACELQPGTMVAVLGLEDSKVEELCASVEGIVTPANYNCPGQLVISGELKAIETACEKMKEAGTKRAFILPVGGTFHSILMKPTGEELATAIEQTHFSKPLYPVYQNVTTTAATCETDIKKNLINQLTAPVKWTQSVQQMVADGVLAFIEVGPDKVLQGLVKKINKEAVVSSAEV